MGTLDLSDVTKSLINLLSCYFTNSPEMSTIQPTISSQRPDQLKGVAVGFYLYHICQDPHFANLPAAGDLTAAVRHSPMGLQLYYQLVTQYSKESESLETSDFEQNLMGVAMKALHDYPVITDKTTIAGSLVSDETVFVKDLKGTGTRLRIELLNIDQKDAVSYWATSNAPPRLAAYYKVSAVFLQQDPLPSRTGRVLNYGVQTFVGGGPRIDGCSNILTFKMPGSAEKNTIKLSPAQVPVGGKIKFSGTGLNGSDATLLIRHAAWDKFCPVDVPWGPEFSGTEATMTIQETVPDEKGVAQSVVPGIYSAVFRMKKLIPIAGNPPGEVEQRSNECPFMITPRIDHVIDNIIMVPATPDKTITIEGYKFPLEATGNPLYPSIGVYFGNRKLTGIKSAQTLHDGEFFVLEEEVLPPAVPPAFKRKIMLKIPPDPEKGIDFFPIRILVDGAESPPNWIKV